MKNKILLLCFLSLNLTQLRAEQAPVAPLLVKIGHVDMAHIIGSLPETQKLTAEIESYQKQLNKQLEKAQLEFQQKLEIFQKNLDKLKEEERAKKEMELQNLHHAVEVLGAEMRNKLLTKQSTLFQPVHERIEKAVQEVAKEHGYTHIFNSHPGGLPLLIYAIEESDISELVLTKLGSKEKNKAKK